MRARSIALLLLALGCGLVASIGITQVIGNRDNQPADATADTNAIFVALEDIAFGEPLKPEVLRLENWPKGKLPSGALSRIEDVEGRRTRTKLYAGEPILENKLFPKGASEQGYSTVIPKGYRVVPVRVDRVSGSGLIMPGDRVDLLVHLVKNPAKGILETNTRTILQNVKVFAVNDIVETEGQEDNTTTTQTISLLVTPEHAQMVVLAEELGNIRLIMRNYEDPEIVTVQGTTPSQLRDASEAEDARKEIAPDTVLDRTRGGGAGFLAFLKQMRQPKKSPQNDATSGSRQNPDDLHRMQIVSGSEVRDVVLEVDQQRSDSVSGFKIWKTSEWGLDPGSTSAARAPQPEQIVTEQHQDSTEENKPQEQLPQQEHD